MSVETLLNKSLLGGAQAQVIQLNGPSDKLLTLSKRKGRQFLKDFCEAHESMIPLGLHKSTADLSELICQRSTKGFHLSFLLGIDEVAVRTEGLKGRGDGDLVGEQGDAEIAEEHPQGNQSTQTAESTG